MVDSTSRLFQSTHPHGVRRQTDKTATPAPDFNPRTRMGCDVMSSTHPHGVRPGCYRLDTAQVHISIHAPAWGATRGGGGCSPPPRISIHTPAWGATAARARCRARAAHFNPRTRMGCDTAEARSHRARRISIHAPAWGATVSPPQSLRQGRFQSTHPHGVRPLAAVTFAFSLYFNPRTRMGCDNVQYKIFFCNTISIHAPAWGATLITLARCLAMLNFNPRTRMGCDIIWSDLKVAI